MFCPLNANEWSITHYVTSLNPGLIFFNSMPYVSVISSYRVFLRIYIWLGILCFNYLGLNSRASLESWNLQLLKSNFSPKVRLELCWPTWKLEGFQKNRFSMRSCFFLRWSFLGLEMIALFSRIKILSVFYIKIHIYKWKSFWRFNNVHSGFFTIN